MNSQSETNSPWYLLAVILVGGVAGYMLGWSHRDAEAAKMVTRQLSMEDVDEQIAAIQEASREESE